MEDKNKHQFNNGQNDEGQNNHTANSASNEANSEQSHYYSYGPFQSLNKDNSNEQSSTTSDNQVEATPPAPVRPIYSSDSNNAVPSSSPNDHLNNLHNTGNGNGNGGYNGNGYGGNDGNNRKPQFQYNKPKSPIKTVVASVLAGMILMTGGMYGADRANLFTGGEAATTSTGTASTTNATPAESNTVTQAALPAGSADVADVVKTASPAVVKIETYTNSSSGSGGSSSPNYSDPMYRFFFGDQFGGGDGSSGGSGSGNGGNGSGSGSGSSGGLTPLGIGSGFIFDKSGYILTNAHVVGDASTIQVTLEDNKTPYEAKLMGKSTDLDLAVLKIEPTEGQTDFPYISLGNSDNVSIGSWLVAIGNPQGFDHTVTAGVLSAKERSITASDASNGESTKYQHLLQTDASINPGNSGGPLLNMQGQVIGINTAVSEDAQGIGFAIPSNEVAKVVDNLKNGKEIPATPVPFIGASLMTLTPEISKQLGVDTTSGSVVTEVLYRSPAYQADLRSYDVITGINGTAYTNSQDLITAIQKLTVGDNVTLNIIRDGKKMDLKVAIGDRNQYEKTVGTSGTEGNQ
ncbi:S1C family serine protease [Paenibacillus sp. WLX2291]|uniref:S1C family serine protease n=1 Tax=Paenibacillus sp. WLX2291 TaxID=3296934 RepID=UPI003983DD9E